MNLRYQHRAEGIFRLMCNKERSDLEFDNEMLPIMGLNTHDWATNRSISRLHILSQVQRTMSHFLDEEIRSLSLPSWQQYVRMTASLLPYNLRTFRENSAESVVVDVTAFVIPERRKSRTSACWYIESNPVYKMISQRYYISTTHQFQLLASSRWSENIVYPYRLLDLRWFDLVKAGLDLRIQTSWNALREDETPNEHKGITIDRSAKMYLQSKEEGGGNPDPIPEYGCRYLAILRAGNRGDQMADSEIETLFHNNTKREKLGSQRICAPFVGSPVQPQQPVVNDPCPQPTLQTQPKVKRPQYRKQDNCCVFIPNIHPEVTIKDVFEAVHTGKVFFVCIHKPKSRHPNFAAKIVFYERSASQAFLSECKNGKVLIKGLPAYARENHEVIGFTALHKGSRVVKITGLPSNGSVTVRSFLSECLGNFDYQVSHHQVSYTVNSTMSFEIGFASAKPQASAVTQRFPAWLQMKGLNSNEVKIEYTEDPCAH